MLRSHRRAHAWIWTFAGLALPLVLAGALIYKATRPALPPNSRIAPPIEATKP
jgi:hypothetical protein